MGIQRELSINAVRTMVPTLLIKASTKMVREQLFRFSFGARRYKAHRRKDRP